MTREPRYPFHRDWTQDAPQREHRLFERSDRPELRLTNRQVLVQLVLCALGVTVAAGLSMLWVTALAHWFVGY